MSVYEVKISIKRTDGPSSGSLKLTGKVESNTVGPGALPRLVGDVASKMVKEFGAMEEGR